jgi:hypothetical protein
MFAIVAGYILLSFITPTALAGDVIVDRQVTGSAPPVPEIYSCLKEIEDSPYNEVSAHKCLQDILASGYFNEGRIEVDSMEGRKLVRFILEAPELRIESLDIKTGIQRADTLRAWLQKDRRTLNEDDTYELYRDTSTRLGIRAYFSSRGQWVGISRTVELNYKTRSASLLYHIVEGPPIPAETPDPPYGPVCHEYVGTVVWNYLNDHVPVALVKRLGLIHSGFECFSSELVTRANETLQHSQLFQHAEVIVEGSSEERQVSFAVEGRELTVSEVSVVRFGLAALQQPADPQNLPLRSGDIYTRSKANDTKEVLERLHANPRWCIDIYEDAEIDDGGRVRITYYILANPKDEVILNGRSFMFQCATS